MLGHSALIAARGAISLVLFPFVGHSLGMSDLAFGMWAGLWRTAVGTGALIPSGGQVMRCWHRRRYATIGFIVLRLCSLSGEV